MNPLAIAGASLALAEGGAQVDWDAIEQAIDSVADLHASFVRVFGGDGAADLLLRVFKLGPQSTHLWIAREKKLLSSVEEKTTSRTAPGSGSTFA